MCAPAEELRAGFGEPFPLLPSELVGDGGRGESIRNRIRPPQRVEIWRKRTGIEPARDSITAPQSILKTEGGTSLPSASTHGVSAGVACWEVYLRQDDHEAVRGTWIGRLSPLG